MRSRSVNGNSLLRDIINVKTYMAVVEMMSFTKAARKLNCSQPAITNRIKQIEKLIGVPVAIRKKNGLTLTREGKQLYHVMKVYSASVHEAEEEIKQIREKHYSFIIGASSVVADFILPLCMHGIQKNADAQVYFRNDECEKIIEALGNNAIDMAIVESEVIDNEFVSHEWIKDEIVLFSRTPLEANIDPKALYTFSMIFHPEQTFIGNRVHEVFEHFNIQHIFLDILAVVDNISSIKETVLHYTNPVGKQLVSWIPKIVIGRELASQRLYASRIAGDPIEQQFYMVYKKERSNDPAIGRMMDYLQSVSQSYTAA